MNLQEKTLIAIVLLIIAVIVVITIFVPDSPLAYGALLGLVILLLFHLHVRSRIGYLKVQIRNLGMEHDFTRRIAVIGDDEFSGLAIEINHMLAEIEQSNTDLMRSTDRFRDLAELLPQIIFEMDMSGRITFMNHVGLEMAQCTSTRSAQGLSAYDFLAKADQKRMQQNLERLAGAKPSVEAVYTFIRPNGSTFPGNTYVSAIIQNGEIKGYRGIIVDITSQQELKKALDESREYLEQIFDTLTVGVLLIDAETHRIIDLNRAASDMIGARKDQIFGKECHRFVCPAERGHCPITDLHETIDNTEHVLLTADGRQVPIIKHVARIKLHGRDFLLETFIDNTGRKKMENALLDSTQMLSSIFQASPVGVFRNDRDGRVVFVNEKWVSMTGLSLEQIQGTYWAEALHPEDRDRVLREIGQSIEDKKEISIESRLIRPDGAITWLLGQVVPLHDAKGEVYGWVGTITDITERKQMEMALAESENKYRALAENTSDVLLSYDLNGTITYISPMIERYMYLVEEVVSQPLTRFVHLHDRERLVQNLKKQIAGKPPIESTFRLMDKMGEFHWVEEKATIQTDASGNPVGINSVLRDFTDRKKAEEAILLANKKLNLLNSITRHDILNTVTGLLGCVDMAKATTDPKEQAVLLNDIKELVSVIQRQIAFTREYQSVGVNAPAWQNVGDVINRAIVNFALSGLVFHVEIINTEIFADPLLEKVFYNLVDNAIRYGETITMIKFYYLFSDKGLSLICEDDGVGVPADQKKNIFERGVGKNTGMGLFLTREILLITGNTIEENGKPGHGARFEIIIPNGAFRFVLEKKEK